MAKFSYNFFLISSNSYNPTIKLFRSENLDFFGKMLLSFSTQLRLGYSEVWQCDMISSMSVRLSKNLLNSNSFGGTMLISYNLP